MNTDNIFERKRHDQHTRVNEAITRFFSSKQT